MTNTKSKIIFIARNLILIILTLQMYSSTGQVKEKSVNDKIENEVSTQPLILNQSTTFPQIHTNLNGMVTEFVRAMYQDKKGNYWFGTNANGIIRYDGKSLEKIKVKTTQKRVSVREIVEDKAGNVWFATSTGLVKFDSEKFATYSTEVGLKYEEIWSICIDRKGLIWVSTGKGVSHFDGEKFTPFILPETRVENPQPMLSDKLVFQFLEDKQGNIWIGTFNGGVSKFDGKTYTNFTKVGIIEGVETYNFCEDKQGNIWFSAEGYGVYRYDGANFTQFTTDKGLTTNVVQSIYEDNKGQLWFGTWQGISIYDGQKFMNAKDKEPWTN